MAQAAWNCLERKPDYGIVITKYGYSRGAIGTLKLWEAGHPVPDKNTFQAARRALALTADLEEQDTVLLLLSGGGSALFEQPVIPGKELEPVTRQLLASGASIVEMNTVRKRLSQVKGGRFAQHCAPAKIYSIILSDIICDPLDMIASGPAFPDCSTCQQALNIVDKYKLELSSDTYSALKQETPKTLDNVETQVIGGVRELCAAAASACQQLGYRPMILTDCLTCQARETGEFLAAIARSHQNTNVPLAFLAGGETVVQIVGTGKGGRNQELALSAAHGIAGLERTAIFSVGSDGTDGPTDAAGGFVTGETEEVLAQQGISIFQTLCENNAYPALAACGGLIITGPTGTNVNDVAVLLIDTGRESR